MINRLLSALVAELEAGEVPAPLTQPLTLAAVWCDLARLAGEAPPADVAALVEGEPVELPERVEPRHFFEEPCAAALAARYGARPPVVALHARRRRPRT